MKIGLVLKKIRDVETPELEIGNINSGHITENIVKSNIEIVVISMLSEKPMSGYDI